MNIEEERKAFEKVCIQKRISVTRTNVAMMFANGKQMGVGDYFEPAYTAFEFWIQAKQHAEEMAKAPVKIRKGYSDTYPWLVEHGDGIFEGQIIDAFKSLDDAKVWAQTNGYRVIE